MESSGDDTAKAMICHQAGMALRLRDERARPRMGKSGFAAQIGMERLKRNYGTGPVESAAARRGPIKDPRPGEEKSKRGDR